MKYSLSTTLLALTAMTLMIMTVGSSGLRGLQSVSTENLAAPAAPAAVFAAPSVKISGVSTLLQILNSATAFTNSTFDIITIDSFFQSITDQGVAIQGKVTLTNDQGESVTGLISGLWDHNSNKIVFNATKYEVETEESDSEGDSDDSDNSSDVDTNNSTDVNNNSTDVNNNSTDVNNNGTSTIIPPGVPVNFTYISPADFANNIQAQAALDWGVDALIQKTISQYKLPAASPDYNVTNLIIAAYKTVSTGTSYSFQVNLANALKYKVDANITVSYRASNQTYKLAGYAFRSYNYPSGAIVIPQNNTNATNSTNNATNNGSSPSNVTVPDNSTVVNPGNVTQPGSNSTSNVTVPANNTNPTNSTAPVNPTTADNYTIFTSDQLSQDSIAQGALQNGTNTLIQLGISQNKIPAANSNYTINNVTLAAFKKQLIGTYYKFTVNMINADYVHLDANLTVFYRTSTKAYSLNGYSFRSYNFTRALNSTNNTNNGNSSIPIDMDPPLYDDGNGNVTLIFESDGSSGAR